MKGISAVVTALVIVFSLSHSAHAQMQLGTVSTPTSASCAGFSSNSTCWHAFVSCPNTADLGVTWGVRTPTGTIVGTVLLFNGSGGTVPGLGSYGDYYIKHGLTAIQVAWDSPWEVTGAGLDLDIPTAGCRGATMLNFLAPSTGAYCAQGFSAGSAAVGYALAWYGSDSKLANVELMSGPVLSNIEQGCERPDDPAVTITPTNGNPFSNTPQYVAATAPALTNWTGPTCRPTNVTRTSDADNAEWLEQSIVHTGAKLSYPATKVAGWLCDNGLNNSAAQGGLFYTAMGTGYTLTRMSGCQGPEGVTQGTTPQGVTGQVAIEKDMVAQCVKP